MKIKEKYFHQNENDKIISILKFLSPVELNLKYKTMTYIFTEFTHYSTVRVIMSSHEVSLQLTGDL